MNKKEITFELTNFCEENCNYCSSSTSNRFSDKNIKFLSINKIKKILSGNTYDHIILSGGEPLAHPNFYNIYKLCKKHTDDVIVYSNLITHRIFNANVIDGVYLEANLTLLPEVDKIHILRRIKQGREKHRPEVHLSRNYFMECSCDHNVIIPNGEITLTPCNKDKQKLEKNIYKNKFYICGAHGVGKTTILYDISKKINIELYINNSNNPHKDNIYKRQLWRLLKYIFDDEMIKTNKNSTITTRCCLDWLIYTETFKDLNWISNEQYEILINKYETYFNDKIPINIIYINPDIEWSKERIMERWKSHSVKWREENFKYYDLLRKKYNNIFNRTSKIENIIEINETDKNSRINNIIEIIQ